MKNLRERMKKLHHPDSICFVLSMKLFCFQHMAEVTSVYIAASLLRIYSFLHVSLTGDHKTDALQFCYR